MDWSRIHRGSADERSLPSRAAAAAAASLLVVASLAACTVSESTSGPVETQPPRTTAVPAPDDTTIDDVIEEAPAGAGDRMRELDDDVTARHRRPRLGRRDHAASRSRPRRRARWPARRSRPRSGSRTSRVNRSTWAARWSPSSMPPATSRSPRRLRRRHRRSERFDDGEAAEGTYVFRIPEDTRNEITLTVDYAAGAPVVVFHGSGDVKPPTKRGEASCSSSRSWHRSGLAMFTAAAVVAAGMLVGGAQPGDGGRERARTDRAAEQLDGHGGSRCPPCRSTPASCGRRRSSGNTVFAGGSFSNARPAGAAPGTNLIPRSNILAYNLTTGVITLVRPADQRPGEGHQGLARRVAHLRRRQLQLGRRPDPMEHRRVRRRHRRAPDDVQAGRRRVVRQRDRGHELRGLRRRPDRRGRRGRPQEPRRVQHERRPARMGADHRPAGRQHGADALGRQADHRGAVRDGQQRLPARPRGARPQHRCDPALDRALHRAERRRRRQLAAPARRASGSSRRTPTPSTAPDGCTRTRPSATSRACSRPSRAAARSDGSPTATATTTACTPTAPTSTRPATSTRARP